MQRPRARSGAGTIDDPAPHDLSAAEYIGAWSLDLDTLELSASATCRSTFGRDGNASFTYDDLRATIHPEDCERMTSAVARSIESGCDYDIEYRIVTPTGELRWVDIRGQVALDDTGRPCRMSGISIDMTSRRSAEARRRSRQQLSERLRDLDDPAEIAYAAADLLGRTLQVSRAGYGTIDPVAETITIERDWNADGVQSLAGVLRFREYGSYIDELKRGETVVVDDARLDPRTTLTADALIGISARSFINMPVTEHGGLVGLLYVNHRDTRHWTDDDLAFVREVGERTRAAVARRIAEEQLRSLAASLESQVAERTRERDRTWNNSQDLLVVVDQAGVFQAANPAWERILGWTQSEVVGHRHTDFSHPDDVAGSEGALQVATHRRLPRHENRMRHRDGSYRWIAWVASPDDGLVYASGRHITAEKEAALELEAAQEQLRQSQKMEAVGQLTGGLAHDFNNLLTGITGSLELLEVRLAQGRTNEIDRYVRSAQSATKRAAALTHRLLAFSRRQTLDPRIVDVNRLIADLEELVRRTVGPQIEVEVVGATGLWSAFIDANQLENALLNLCINARDAMPDGGRLTIETSNKWIDERSARERDLVAGQYIALCVTDTGTGMTPDTAARAFDPFFTTKPLGAGTGLGLSMVYGFARQSGGQVRVYTELGQGTTMCLYLPRQVGIDDVSQVDAEVRPHRARQEGRTVLVVDDEPTVRMLVLEIVEGETLAALEAVDGAGALTILRSDARIDLLITDVGLPGGINGRQVADAARLQRPDLPVLFITGYAENAAVGNGHLGHGMSLLTKPFSVVTLTRRIHELIGDD